MCGICGSVSFKDNRYLTGDVIKGMCRAIQHRGPDESGEYLDQYAMLGIQRLSIIDLQTGQQPISNEDGTLWIVYNGEFYNFGEVRKQLENSGHQFKSRSDTEVILHAYEEYGLDCLQKINGMFAFAIWDTTRRTLFLARDRLGIKPLFYWVGDNQIVFGSELKALLAHPDVPRRVDYNALDHFISLEYIPAPRTIFAGINKLLPGYYLVFMDDQVKVQEYWDIQFHPPHGGESVDTTQLSGLLDDAVRLQLVSDVPLGAFLSGGIDSSTVVAMMSRNTTNGVHTFSIGFEDETYNEIDDARAVAKAFGSQHQDRILKSDIPNLVPSLVSQFDEPFGDFSIFPTYLVSKLARESVKVVLSGDGGDEIFGGYDTYLAQKMDRYYRWLPLSMRTKALPGLMDLLPPQPAKKGAINKLKRFVEGGSLPAPLQHVRWMIFLSEVEKSQLYSNAFQSELNQESVLSVFEAYFQKVADQEPLTQQQYVDIKTYLADDILVKVDRMSMFVSLETRVPLLDHRIVEFALNLPAKRKLNYWQTKIILRETMRNILPQRVFNKPKQGFSIPIKHWLRSSLKPMLNDLLSEDTIRKRGYFEPATVTQWIQEHLSNKANHSHRLWALLVLELWHQQVLENNPAKYRL